MGYISVVSIIATILALAATIVMFILVFPQKRKDKLNGFFKTVRKLLSSEYLLIEKILHFLYVFSTILSILLGVLMLFWFETRYSYSYYYDYSSSYTRWYGYYGITLLVFGPIMLRVIYEIFMMFINLVKNTMDIRNHLINNKVSDPFNAELPVNEESAKSEQKASAAPAFDREAFLNRQAFRQSQENAEDGNEEENSDDTQE
ncbi:MAG: hypothetical protein II920_01895 [Clostridia bacterium]|nr:hypothetical protein [Clostridia bacterium]